ncbi:MAG: SUMF1/EgtB/PvdO family nonheme iron enzyme [Anaerolineales bacterium]|nr:SUMF1/EgtB/PvdO family nonheme iron enzyme [Anaerolineales bacterium]
MNQIGRYQLQGMLGQGGMATVYRAYDPNFRRDVAIKVLPANLLSQADLRARFQREAETIAALEHPAIVPVYDFGEDSASNQPYIVMRLMTGGSLAERLRGGPLALGETVRLYRQLAPALDQAHARGVVHRDLKPGNILFDGSGNAYVADFGLAKLTDSNTQLSATGLMGTPAYMSPEQARGDKEIGPASDIYAMGAMLFHTLSGKLPYEADTAVGMALRHVTDPVPQLSLSRPGLPRGCDNVIATAMAKTPATRYASAGTLVSALETLTAQGESTSFEPVMTLPPGGASESPPGRASQPPARRSSAAAQAPVQLPPPPPSGRNPLWWLLPAGLAGVVVVLGIGALAVAAMMWNNTATRTPLAAVSPTAPIATADPSTPVPIATTAAAPAASPTAAAIAATTEAPPDAPTEPPTEPAPGATEVALNDGMTLVFLGARSGFMGRDSAALDQGPEHAVELSPYWMDQHEVTNAMYARCVEAGVCGAPRNFRSFTRVNYFDNPAFADFPVVYVTRDDAHTYCEWAGRRLPTEAEWEMAARTAANPYPWPDSDSIPAVAQLLNFKPSGFNDTTQVMSYPGGATALGLFDLAGNVWEWVADPYDPAYYNSGERIDPQGPTRSSGPPDACNTADCGVLRGGSWDSDAEQVRVTTRLFYGAQDTRDAFGFRCVRN